MVLSRPGSPLALDERPVPAPGAGQVLVKVAACGVCRTDLHIVDGELAQARLPIVPGHEVVGHVVSVGPGADGVAPVGALVPLALKAVRPGGIVVCGGIHMSDIPSFPYDLLWRERKLVSVANLTRADGEELLALAPAVPLKTEIETFPLAAANEGLARLREGRLRGAAVLVTG